MDYILPLQEIVPRGSTRERDLGSISFFSSKCYAEYHISNVSLIKPLPPLKYNESCSEMGNGRHRRCDLPGAPAGMELGSWDMGTQTPFQGGSCQALPELTCLSPSSVYRKRAHSPSSKDEHSIGLKDSLLAHSSDPVEMRRLNYQTPGRSSTPPRVPPAPVPLHQVTMTEGEPQAFLQQLCTFVGTGAQLGLSPGLSR